MNLGGEARLAFVLLAGGLLTLAAAMVQARRERFQALIETVVPRGHAGIGKANGPQRIPSRDAARRAANWALASPLRAALSGGFLLGAVGLLTGAEGALLLAGIGVLAGVLAVRLRKSSRTQGQELAVAKAVIRISALQAAILRAGGAVTIEASVGFATRGRDDPLSLAVQEGLVDARHGMPWDRALQGAVEGLDHQRAASWIQAVIQTRRSGQPDELINSLEGQVDAGYGDLANRGEAAAGKLNTRILVVAAVFGLPCLIGIILGMMFYHAGGGPVLPVGQ